MRDQSSLLVDKCTQGKQITTVPYFPEDVKCEIEKNSKASKKTPCLIYKELARHSVLEKVWCSLWDCFGQKKVFTFLLPFFFVSTVSVSFSKQQRPSHHQRHDHHHKSIFFVCPSLGLAVISQFWH